MKHLLAHLLGLDGDLIEARRLLYESESREKQLTARLALIDGGRVEELESQVKDLMLQRLKMRKALATRLMLIERKDAEIARLRALGLDGTKAEILGETAKYPRTNRG